MPNSPRIHPETIEQVKERADLVEVISDHVVLRFKGKEYLGLCPFHNEKTPSFNVNPQKQLYYCFGCGAGGGTFKFLMEIGKQSFAEVVLDLAKRYQIPVQTIEPEKSQSFQQQLSLKDKLYEIMAVAANFYQNYLRQPQGNVALTYLRSTRELKEETISQFQLGYAPNDWSTLYGYLVASKRYPADLVERVGLIAKRPNGSGYYDLFRERVMIPIWDTQGRVIGFGSRALGDVKPKYLNSPQTPLFDKSRTLYALDRAHGTITKEDKAIVVEGFFDAIALHTAGIKNVVASLGTALTQNQLKQLIRYTPSSEVILNFDTDGAGVKATTRAIAQIKDLVNAGVVQLRILNLPDGKDADEYLKTGTVELYREALANAPLWLDWQIEQIGLRYDLATSNGFSKAAVEMVEMLKPLSDLNQLNYYLRHCAEMLSRGDARLITQNLNALKSQVHPKQIQKRQRSPIKPSRDPETEKLERAESLLLFIYIHRPDRRERIIKGLEEKDLSFSLPHYRSLWHALVKLIDNSEHSLNLMADFPDLANKVAHLLNPNYKTEAELLNTPTLIEKAIDSLKIVALQKYKNYCIEQIKTKDPRTDPQYLYYYEELQKTERALKKR